MRKYHGQSIESPHIRPTITTPYPSHYTLLTATTSICTNINLHTSPSTHLPTHTRHISTQMYIHPFVVPSIHRPTALYHTIHDDASQHITSHHHLHVQEHTTQPSRPLSSTPKCVSAIQSCTAQCPSIPSATIYPTSTQSFTICP